jgi:4-amino-4-deoxy-L-arabinose transferase-like glycosyltransferase
MNNLTKFSPKKILLFILIIAAGIRLWRISGVPVSLFSDELDVGYQAYSLVETGKDYFGNPWPLYFKSYSDMRTPVYIYSSVPSVAIFGITPLGVRLPAVIFGVLGIWAIYLLVKEAFDDEELGIIAAFVLAVSPWHIQFSRAAFEVTELLFFLMMGIYFFFKSFKKRKYLILTSLFLGITPWIYSTAKLFTPLAIFALLVIWKDKILKVGIKYLTFSFVVLALLGIPLIRSVFTGTGTERFSYVSVFTDPTTVSDVAYERLFDVRVEGTERNILQKASSRVIHNKYFVWGNNVAGNYLKAISTDFLFINGDPNLRHSPDGVGELYKVEMITLIFGAFMFFAYSKDKKFKLFLGFWLFFGILPSAITRDGGNHATRLILILPVFVFFISYGILRLFTIKNSKIKPATTFGYLALVFTSFYFYQHNYYVHYPWDSERWWHSGYRQVIAGVKEYRNNFETVVITNAVEPPEIFFAAYFPYPPEEWQKGFSKETLSGFGEMKKIDKYYFGQMGEEGIGELYSYMDENMLYIAAEREVGENLIMEPQKTPAGLKLIRAVTYPSGEPAFYFFKKNDDYVPPQKDEI